ncbi:MAG: helix-turn-helix domain-containing protein [Desulfobacterales bacterium]|nr:helix-turn-helix domain-containing protein [Desulfobacterales bacterium]MDD4073013.1 helix-turn-helix domain-containing protein [Desulfobacterales bacterium]MDD4391501.1 helix-turn-helix domain-containing protein [Desulfobacterales bacterium]
MIKPSEISTADFKSRGIGPIGFDFADLADVYGRIGNLMIEPHRHSFYEVIWFTRSLGKHFVDFAAYDIRPNTLFFISKNQVHSYEKRNDIQGHLMRFQENFVRKLPDDRMAWFHYSLFKPGTPPFRLIPDSKCSFFSTLITLIQRETGSSDQHRHEDMLLDLLDAFLIEAERIEPEYDSSSMEQQTIMNVYYEFVSHLEQHYTEHYRVEQYAELVKLSPKRLSEICRTVTGMTAKKLIEERVVLEAKRYIRYSGLSIKQVCHRLGFEDPAYFSKFFKKVTSTSPTQFRQAVSEMYKQK